MKRVWRFSQRSVKAEHLSAHKFTLFLILLTSIFASSAASASSPAPNASPTPTGAISTSPTPSATQNPTGTTSGIETSQKPARKIYSGWIPYYSVRGGVARTIAYKEMIGEVSPFWYSLTGAKTIKNQFTSANPSLRMNEQIDFLRAQGFKILPAITDGTKKLVLYGLLAKESSRRDVVSTITNLVVNNNFDGIDLDLEGFAFVDGSTSWNKTKPVWTQFIVELSASLRAKNKLLSVTTPVLFDPATGRKGSYHVYNWAGIAPYIDRLRIMTYDFSVSKPGPIGPLEWTEASLKYAISVLPASKVWVGIPGYGRDWITKVEGKCPQNVAKLIKPGAKAAVFDVAKGGELALAYGTTPVYDAVRGEATFTYQKSYNGLDSAGEPVSCTATRVAWFQDTRAYLARAEFVSKYRIGGLVHWTMSQGSIESINALLNFARTIGPDEVIATIISKELSSSYGSTERLTALFSLKDKSPIENLEVLFQYRRDDAEPWNDLSQVRTSRDGKAMIDLMVGSSVKFRAITQESWERTASQTETGSIKVSRILNISAPTYAKIGGEFEVVAQLIPRTGDLTLQRKNGDKWRDLESGSVSETDGNYIFSVKAKARGFMTLRIIASENDKYNSSTSEPFNVFVR